MATTGAAGVTNAAYIETRQVGAATITVINDGDVVLPLDFLFSPAAIAGLRERGYPPDEQTLTSAQLIVHVALGDASIVIDPAFDDPGTPWDRRFATRWLGHHRSPGLAAALAALGVAPEAVTEVLITHAHDDHFVGVLRDAGDCLQARFPNARHLIGRADWLENPKREESGSELATRLGPIAELGLLTPVEGEYAVAPGVTMIAAPGETPGHSIVRVQSGGATFWALGDLFHHPIEIERTDWYASWDEPVTLAASRRAFLDAVQPDDLVVFTHAPFPGWGHVVRDGDGYRWQEA